MAQTNCRIPDELDAAYSNAADERRAFKSEVLRKALRYYVIENPDGFDSFRRYNRVNGQDDDSGGGGASESRETVDTGDSASEQSGLAGSDQSGVYDPTAEV